MALCPTPGEQEPPSGQGDPRYLKFFQQFNQEAFFEAHETLEILWRETYSEERDFYQALIQTAAACVHLQKGNLEGAEVLHAKVEKLFSRYPKPHLGVDTEDLLAQLQKALQHSQNFPKITPLKTNQ